MAATSRAAIVRAPVVATAPAGWLWNGLATPTLVTVAAANRTPSAALQGSTENLRDRNHPLPAFRVPPGREAA
ncbi:hypothetical protein Athai_64870 [Actinocatenispora thailandica]|uniref:Uncharacterized protein n=1 Tax=Actinocatenispora thailandica TaxID=227318 RepID=A0A7R7DW53_9ACTN|nr:hypothetical protein Athai_64870 [Actinocatenispora thailandica]